jgi:predicted DNA-binding transcriptional regulator YafY
VAKKQKQSKQSIPPGRTTPIPAKPDRDRRARQHARIARVLQLLSLIQSRGRWNSRAIAQELEVSERTVYRDLEVLEFAGVPWYFDDEDQCYRVRCDFRFPTLGLSEEEATGQAISTALASATGLGSSQGSASTTRKLSANSSQAVQQTLSDAARLIEVFDLKLVDHSRHQEAIKAAQHALLNGKQLIGNYESPYEDDVKRIQLHPYRLCLIKNAWYLIGHEQGLTEPRTYRIARFRTLRFLDELAIVPRDFSLKGYFGNAWSVYRGLKSYNVGLWFKPHAAKVVGETQWHHTQEVIKHHDGSITLQFTVDGLTEILNWLLSWTGRVEVKQPQELRGLFVEALRRGIEDHHE